MSEETLSSKVQGGAIDFSKFAFMESAPRFGYSNNIAQLASPDMSRRWNYANGVFAFCIFFLAFFILWAFVVLALKWAGMRRVGCAAGQVAFQPNDLYFSDVQIRKRHQKIQLAFIACTGLLFVGGGFLLKNGLPTIDIAVRETLAFNEDVKMALDVGLKVANSADRIRSNFLNSRVHEMLLSENYCDNVNITVATILLDTTNNSNYTQESLSIFENFQNILQEEEVDGIKSGLLHITQNLHHFDNMLVFYSTYHWIARMFLLTIFNLCLFMLGSTIYTMLREDGFPPLTCLTSYLVLPLFTIFIFVVCFVTALVASGAIMNSDFCVGSGEGPESTIQNALLENGFSVGDLTYKSFKYFQSDCTESQPWDDKVATYRDLIEDSVDVSRFLLSQIDDIGDENLTSICGRDFMPVISEIDEAKRDLSLLSANIDKALELSRCDRIAPLYRQFFNGPTCTKTLEGLSWTFYGLFAVCVTGAILFSIRSALYQVEVIHVEDEISLEGTLEQAKEIKQTHSNNCQTDLSLDSDDNMESVIQREDAIDVQERKVRTDGELEPLTPTGENRNVSINFNSPTSTLSSHLSHGFDVANEEQNEEVRSP